jgi:hypothetical protein
MTIATAVIFSLQVVLRLPMTIATAAIFNLRVVLHLPMTIAMVVMFSLRAALRLPTIIATAATYLSPADKQQQFSTSPWSRWDRPGVES